MDKWTAITLVAAVIFVGYLASLTIGYGYGFVGGYDNCSVYFGFGYASNHSINGLIFYNKSFC